MTTYRYRQVPTFGRGTIRRFHTNVSAMKHLAAHDFEDLLQCAIPVFEGLLPPEHNTIVLNLLFKLATWHAYAKLHVHTNNTLTFFNSATVILGQSVRKFQCTICAHYHMTELPNEYTACGCREAALASKQAGPVNMLQKGKSNPNPKVKALNLFTYKYHALADYPNTIQQVGTSDSYSTQPVSDRFVIILFSYNLILQGELEHHRAKRQYPRTGKKKSQMLLNMTSQEAQECLIEKVTAVLAAKWNLRPWRA
ncbi:hypothetical protein F4604DRAFT_1574283 [Suillus subluteus]|nr:hypothetical protein F4604DRAFT_1574283 [Suillus subluteus]